MTVGIRMALYSLKARLRNNFNVAVTQIADQDKWQKATLLDLIDFEIELI